MIPVIQKQVGSCSVLTSKYFVRTELVPFLSPENSLLSEDCSIYEIDLGGRKKKLQLKLNHLTASKKELDEDLVGKRIKG